jgi:hypothetical protein
MPRTRLILFDASRRPSLFDSGAAIDADIDIIESLGLVTAEEVPQLVHDALFSRKPGFHTAFWIGGQTHDLADAIAQATFESQVAPFYVNVAVDPSGANTTAAAVVELLMTVMGAGDGPLLVVGGTGMVGQAIVTMASWMGFTVWVHASKESRVRQVAQNLAARYHIPEPAFWTPTKDMPIAGVISAGPPGVEVFQPQILRTPPRVLIDLNAVAPSGIRGVQPDDTGRATPWGASWGAYAVGHRKMKLHHRLLKALFEPPHRFYDRRAILDLALNT